MTQMKILDTKTKEKGKRNILWKKKENNNNQNIEVTV